MIVNTGQRTDIPAFYSEWFANRLKAGFVLVRNPYRPDWITRYELDPEVVDCIAVSQGLPGVIAINMATYIGHYKKGLPGALIATFGVVLPSFCIIIAVVEILHGVGDNQYVNGALAGIKAAATGLIAYSAYKVGRQVLKNAFAWVLAIGSFAAIAYFGFNAVYAILAGIVLGLLYEAVKTRKNGRAGEEQ